MLKQKYWMLRCEEIEPELQKIINEYLKKLSLENKAEATVIKYRSVLKQFFIKYNKPLKEISADDVLNWVNALNTEGKSPRTVLLYINGLDGFFSFCYEEEYVDAILVKKRWRPKLSKALPKYLTSPEVARLKLNAEKLCIRDRAIVIFALSSGCRRSEISKLNVEDIDLDNRTALVIGKGDKERKVHFSQECALLISEYLSNDPRNEGPLFLNKYGTRLSDAGIYEIIVKLREMANLPAGFSPHWLRHTYGHEMISRGADINFIAEGLGHSNLDTTRVYTKIPTDELRSEYNTYME